MKFRKNIISPKIWESDTDCNEHNVSVRQSKFGLGIFATRKFIESELIFTLSGSIISLNECLLLGDKECFPFQISREKYIYPDSPGAFINHSCDPNCGIKDDLTVIAIKDIQPGDELFFDYSTTMLEKHWTMQCDCGSINCRQIIDDFDKLPKKLQDKYLSQNIVQSFIRNFLNGNNQSDT